MHRTQRWVVLLLMLLVPAMAQAQPRRLTTDTSLQFCAGEAAVWKAGTVVTLDDSGRVLSGTLARNTTIRYCASESLEWQADASVTFRTTPTERCWVESGTLAADTLLRVAASASAKFKGGTIVTFQPAPPDIRCRVSSGILAEHTGLHAVGNAGTPTSFTAGTFLLFDAKGLARTAGAPGAAAGNLTGRWAAFRDGRKVGDCSIQDNRGQLVFIIHRSPEERSTGRYLDSRTVVANGWGPQRGKISADGHRIDWANSYWERVK